MFENNLCNVTIVVPTYKRDKFLDEMLGSVKSKAENFNVVILDNASGDNTREVALKWAKELNLEYHAQNKTVGANENLCNAVSLAKTQWVMIMADDDIIQYPLANIEKMLETTDVDVIVLGRCDAHINLEFIRNWPYLKKKDKSSSESGYVYYSDPGSLLADGLCLTAAFGFISGLIVKKDAWEQSCAELSDAPFSKYFAQSLYRQSWILLNLLNKGKKALFINQPYIIARHGNDRICNDPLDRMTIDVVEFSNIANYLNWKDPITKRLMKKLIYKHMQRHMFPNSYSCTVHCAKAYGKESWKRFSKNNGRYLTVFQKLVGYFVSNQANSV